MKFKQFVLAWSLLCVFQHFAVEANSRARQVGSFVTANSEGSFGTIDVDNDIEIESLSGEQDGETKGKDEITPRYRRQLRPVVDNNSSVASPESARNHTCQKRLSCRNNCSTPRRFILDNQLSCFCDRDCAFFKDCCADYEEYCSANKSQMNNQISLITRANKGSWECYVGEQLTGIDGFWMIGSCPKSWPKNDTFYQCRNLSAANTITKDNYQYLPVYTSDGTVYHNRFCAQCNGIKPQNLGEYKLFFGCSIMPPKLPSREKKIEFLFDYCEARNIYWYASEKAPRRFCLSLEEPDGYRCKEDSDGKCTNGSVGIVSIPSKHSNYKNKHCADLCGGFGKHPCGPLALLDPGGFFRAVQPFSIVFDFRDNRKETGTVKVDCPFKHFYDPFLETCRKGRSQAPQALLHPNHQEYKVILWMKSSVPVDFQMRIKMQNAKFDPKIAGEVLKIKEHQLGNCKTGVLSSILFSFEFNLNVSFRQNNTRTRSRRSLITANDHYVERITNFANPFQLTYLSYNFTVFKVTKRILSCPNLQKYNRNEYRVPPGDTSAVVIIKTREVMKSGEFYTVNDTKPNDSEAIFICRDHWFPNCSGKWILRHEGEFVVPENKSLFVNSSEKVFGLSSYIWANHSVYVCEMFSSSYNKQGAAKPLDPHLVKMTYVCMLISIVSLIYVLITYSLFTELRTPPGINLMNLSVSILLAKSLWILGSGQTDKPMACNGIAVLLHYLFLVSFVWTSIIAFDTWKAFAARGTRAVSDSKRGRIMHSLKYMAFGWLSSMLYVTFCVILDATRTVNIGYIYKTGHKACWMSNPKAILFLLAIPVGFILTFNVIFYALTLKAIASSTAQAKAATDHKERKSTFWIYVRIASVMGFTWIFGFAAPFVGKSLWYVFVFFNGLEGLYIALAFGFNQRVRALYKNRFPVLARFSSNSITSDSTKSTLKFEKIHEKVDTKL